MTRQIATAVSSIVQEMTTCVQISPKNNFRKIQIALEFRNNHVVVENGTVRPAENARVIILSL